MKTFIATALALCIAAVNAVSLTTSAPKPHENEEFTNLAETRGWSWHFCSGADGSGNDTCRCNSKVRYGAHGRFYEFDNYSPRGTKPVECNQHTFGGDPIF